MTHTPGPWNLVNRHTVQLGKRNFVGSTNPDYPIKHSDAKLVAAAPDLLEALWDAHEALTWHNGLDFEPTDKNGQTIEQIIKTAIAKATGDD